MIATELRPSRQEMVQRTGRIQFGLFAFLVVTGIVGTSVLTWKLWRENRVLTTRIATLQRIARLPPFDDPNRIGIAFQEPMWYDEKIWKIRIPEGQAFRVVLATRNIPTGFPGDDVAPPAVASKTLTAGEYLLELRRVDDGAGARIMVRINDRVWLEHQETIEGWDPGEGLMGSPRFQLPGQPQEDRSVVLLSERFFGSLGSEQGEAATGTKNGIELRLEKQTEPSG